MLRHGLIHIFVFVGLLALAGCAEEETSYANQTQQFETFLSGSHVPSLVSEEVAVASTEELEFYEKMGQTAYRYIRHYYDPERESRPEVEWGDRISMTFWIYSFENRAITINTMPLYTNDGALRAALIETGLNVGYWSFEPLEVTVGETPILKGAELALPGCREKDTVEVYMTYNLAYGSGLVGIIPEETPVAFFYTIDSVEK